MRRLVPLLLVAMLAQAQEGGATRSLPIHGVYMQRPLELPLDRLTMKAAASSWVVVCASCSMRATASSGVTVPSVSTVRLSLS